jgi:hypothetical protein
MKVPGVVGDGIVELSGAEVVQIIVIQYRG